jgi:hypothetical protein
LGNRERKGAKLFNLNNFVYELSDYLIVMELAAQAFVLEEDDTGQSLTSLHSTLNSIFQKLTDEVGESPSIELKHLYPVAKNLSNSQEPAKKNFRNWLDFDPKTKTYRLSKKVKKQEIIIEIEKLALALECVHNRLGKIKSRIEK